MTKAARRATAPGATSAEGTAATALVKIRTAADTTVALGFRGYRGGWSDVTVNSTPSVSSKITNFLQ